MTAVHERTKCDKILKSCAVTSCICCGFVSGAFIATVYQSLAWHMPARMALIWGTGQTVLAIGLSFTRLLPTL